MRADILPKCYAKFSKRREKNAMTVCYVNKKTIFIIIDCNCE